MLCNVIVNPSLLFHILYPSLLGTWSWVEGLVVKENNKPPISYGNSGKESRIEIEAH